MGHDHHHAAMCGGLDHHSGEYTPQQRADLDLVLAFNHELADAIDRCRDISKVQEFLDPDPLRYMWVDEGQGQIGRVIGEASERLSLAPALEGHRRVPGTVLDGSHQASRVAVATDAHGRRLLAWVEWVDGAGDVVKAELREADGSSTGPVQVSTGVSDVFRPTVAITPDGSAWVLFGQRSGATDDGLDRVTVAEPVRVLAARHDGTSWTEPLPVSDTAGPSFNQEACVHADGRLEVCWQGPVEQRFGIYSRTWHPDRGWAATDLTSRGTANNVWDGTVVALPDGGSGYAWSEYADGSYRIVLRERAGDGALAEPRQLSSGTDYALHPSLAVTTDGRLWCAFDQITVHGHGGSGPTKLRPVESLGETALEGMREAGASVPPELLPEVEAAIRVVCVEDDGLREPPGDLAPRLNVVPSGLPKLTATPDGGLSLAYRVHRQLPLMTYYWEVAVQQLTGDGWAPPTTIRGTDGTLEEPSVAATTDGIVVAAQGDGRLAKALQWTEGFGGRECPYLLEHHGSVIWHGLHGAGHVVTADLPWPARPDPAGLLADVPACEVFAASGRTEARRWFGAGRPERYRAELDGRSYDLYWGDLHRHSLVSRCTAGDEPSLEDFYRYAWDVCDYDFWAVTDHSENSTAFQWWSIQKIADLFHVPGTFVPLYGFEWTSADHGHQNVIYGDVARGAPIFSAFAEGSTDPAGLWAGLAEYPDHPAVTIPHHPGAAMVHNDWDYHDPRYSRLVEVFQACRGNYEYDGCFRQYADGTATGTFMLDGLLRGHKFGLIGSSDHGHGASYVGAFCEDLTREGVFEALHGRRTFAATTRDVILDVRAVGADGTLFLGEEAAGGRDWRLDVHAEAYADLARIDVVADGRTVHSLVPEPDLPAGWLAAPVRLEWGGAESTTAWDGLIEITGGEVLHTPYWSPEVTAASATRVEYAHTTRSFGEPYGAQRGCIEVTLLGPPDARVSVSCGDRRADLRLADLDSRQPLQGGDGHAWIEPGVGGLTSLGAGPADLSWQVPDPAPRFVYVRAFLVDGEMAWSSPIWF